MSLKTADYIEIGTTLMRRALVIGIGLYVTFWFFGAASSVIRWVITAFLLSFAIEPIVKFAEAKLAIKSRGLATGLSILLFAIVFIGLAAMTVPIMVRQIDNIVERLPDYLTDLEIVLADLGIDVDIGNAVDDANSEGGVLSTWLDERAGGAALDIGTQAAGALFEVLTIGLFLFYFVADGPSLRRAICSRLPRVRQRALLETWEIAIDKTGQYFYTRVLLAAASAFVTFVAFTLIGMPYALVLSLWVGLISQFIPGFGAYIAGIVPVVVALGEQGSGTALGVIGILIGYQQIENYIIAPKITSRTMDIHPAFAFGGTIVGASVFGFIGAFMALPVIGVGQAVLKNYGRQYAIIKNELTEEEDIPERPVRQRGKIADKIKRAVEALDD